MMRRSLLTFFMSLVWLLASPSLQWRDSHWVEVGAPPAAAEPAKAESIKVAQSIMTEQPKDQPKKKPVKKTKKRVGSSGGVVTSNQPGFHPMQPNVTPAQPNVTGSVVTPARDPRYPNVPTVPAVVPETSQDRVARCTHQGALGGLPAGEQGTYIHNCAF